MPQKLFSQCFANIRFKTAFLFFSRRVATDPGVPEPASETYDGPAGGRVTSNDTGDQVGKIIANTMEPRSAADVMAGYASSPRDDASRKCRFRVVRICELPTGRCCETMSQRCACAVPGAHAQCSKVRMRSASRPLRGEISSFSRTCENSKTFGKAQKQGSAI